MTHRDAVNRDAGPENGYAMWAGVRPWPHPELCRLDSCTAGGEAGALAGTGGQLIAQEPSRGTGPAVKLRGWRLREKPSTLSILLCTASCISVALK